MFDSSGAAESERIHAGRPSGLLELVPLVLGTASQTRPQSAEGKASVREQPQQSADRVERAVRRIEVFFSPLLTLSFFQRDRFGVAFVADTRLYTGQSLK